MEQENLEPQVEEVEVKQSKFTQVTPLSKYLAMILFILMPFIGGWIGYHYAPEKVVEVEKVVTVKDEIQNKDSKTTFNSIEWTTIPMCNKKDSITFPANMGMKISESEEGNCFKIGEEFEYYIPESINENISIYLLDDADFRFLSFMVYSEEENTIRLYVSDALKKRLYVVDEHTSDSIEFAGHNSVNEFYSHGQLINGLEHIVYRWWDIDSSNQTTSKVFSFGRERVVYSNECIELGGHVMSSKVKDNRSGVNLVFVNCAGEIVYADIYGNQIETKTIEVPDYIVSPVLYGFVEYERIQFYDADVTDDMLRSPVYSVNLDGSNFIKEEKTQYRGF